MIRTPLLSIAFVALLGASTIACAGDEEPSSGPEVAIPPRQSAPDSDRPSSNETKTSEDEQVSAKACVPKTCEQLGETCGKHDDGCGAQADCGVCEACVPKTCQQLGKSCGEHDAGCGKKADCGACAPACVADANGANNTAATAQVLGEFSDSPITTKQMLELKLPDGDEDWYKMAIKDAGFSANPRISASARSLEVTIFFLCASATATNYSTCPNTKDTADNTMGKGCKGTSSTMLQTDCTGINEDGTAYVRVRKLASDGMCAGYSLDLKVD
jgi:hypothetical protein